ncbi:hypothetical protein M501DRAFT_931143 [Patellaria atrata CBS 101060]|uniref:WD40 repeat-like protein n=1 Tax=Patellaria atrata CBS 101060 TaxID=1346257 RepID=A0A9P4SES3_9PEZI|nr:hypothetical protein M501DRAFT_931143 [Patellaria atrata CBS 101060]
MAEHPRRASTALLTAPSIIPPAPPLPPQKEQRRELNRFTKFITQPFSTYSSRPPSAQAHRDSNRTNPLFTRIPGISSSSQDASHRTGLEISALDLNQERTHAILAGREILKTISIDGTNCVEQTNLRSVLRDYASHHATGTGGPGRYRETLDIHDVKWSHGQYSTHIATAGTSGKVVLYDLNRAGVELARLHEHHRQVHRLAFNPHQGYLLLSASQDATVRLWDLRDMRKDVMTQVTCPSREKYIGQNDGVRDLRWSPTDGVEFAFGTDNGVIQRWDFRNAKGPKLKINAHDKMCHSIDWHPDGKHLISASSDRTVKVWDFSSEIRRQKPAWTIRTPYPVFGARWRPPHMSKERQEHGPWQCTQIATFYDREHPTIHIWDFRRPFLPFREITRYSTAPTDLLWHSQDLLWTVGREGYFAQTDVHYAPKVVDRRNLQTFGVPPNGEVSGFAQKRPRRRGSRHDFNSENTYADEFGDKLDGVENSLSRSSADDSIDDSFLSSSFRRHHIRTESNRSTRSLGSTPPSYDDAGKIIKLDESLLSLRDVFKPDQIAFRGVLPGYLNVPVFTYLAQKYKTVSLPDATNIDSFKNIHVIFNQNADYAQRAACYRLAESWRLVGMVVSNALQQRAIEQRRRRIEEKRSSEIPKSTSASASKPERPPVTALLTPAKRTIQSADSSTTNTAHLESTSNLQTPLARPVTVPTTSVIGSLPDPDQGDSIILPPAVIGTTSKQDDTGKEDLRPTLRRPSFSSPGWLSSSHDLDEHREMARNYRAQPRAPLNLEPRAGMSSSPSIGIPPTLNRHDSNESFTMFSASTDSQKAMSLVTVSFASGRTTSHGSMETVPEKYPDSVQAEGYRNGQHNHHNSATSMKSTIESIRSEAKGRRRSSLAFSVGSNGQLAVGSIERQEKVNQQLDTVRRDNLLLRNDSSESEYFISIKGSLDPSPSYNEAMEASGTIVPEGYAENRSPQLEADKSVKEESFVLSDYLSTSSTVDTEQSSPFTVIAMLEQLLDFHTGALTDAQTPSLLILLLSPLLPQTHSLSSIDKETILNSYSEYLPSLGFSFEQTRITVANHLTHLISTGINPLQAESILSTYHSQLTTLSLYVAATYLRRLCYPCYPAVYEQAIKETQVGILCKQCKNPINNATDKMICETCKGRQAPCPVCWSRDSPFESLASKKKAAKARSRRQSRTNSAMRNSGILKPYSSHQNILLNGAAPSGTLDKYTAEIAPVEAAILSPPPMLWSWCPICGHGGHANCLATWFADPSFSSGGCPTEGCMCDCVRGPRRDERLKRLEKKNAEKEKPRVRGDEWRVNESKAVAGARGVLGVPEVKRVRVVEPGIG